MHRSVRNSIRRGLARIPSDTRITVLGHSLGGAMATPADVDLTQLRPHTRDVCTFGAPRVGQVQLPAQVQRADPRLPLWANQFDIVPHVPSLVTGWSHSGQEIEVDGNVDNHETRRFARQIMRQRSSGGSCSRRRD